MRKETEQKFVFNKVIESFTTSWNNHPLRTEKNWSPTRIWTNGMIDVRNLYMRHIGEIYNTNSDQDDLQWFGMDWNAPHPIH